MSETPIIFVRWEQFIHWLLPHTERFPRRVRLSLAHRIDSLALDIFEALIEARYSRERQPALRRASLALEKLRLMLRLAHGQRMLAARSYEHAMRELDEVGRMLGGWIRSQGERA